MSRVLLIGATGGVGRRLLPLLLEGGHAVTALHRKPEQAAALRALGAEPVLGDLMTLTADALTAIADGHDVLVFSAGAAGSGRERTSTIDGEGPLRCVEALRRSGSRRFYLVSAFPESLRDRSPGEGFEHYMRVKKEADAAVAATELDWVILRPGTLRHEDGDDAVSLGKALVYGTVKRGNVAAVLARLIDTPEIRREILELTDGETPVAEAVAAVAAG